MSPGVSNSVRAVSYRRTGAGPRLVLVHGLGASGRWWMKHVEPLSERSEVHTIDLVGFGASRCRQQFRLGVASSVLTTLLERLGVGPVGIVGHSIGTHIAAEPAADVPERVSRLVLVSAAILPAGFVSSTRALNVLRAAGDLPLPFAWTVMSDVARAGPMTVSQAVRELLGTDLRLKLGQITAPALVIWEDRDRVVPISVGQELAAALLDARMAILPEAGCVPMWEHPRAFNGLVADFAGQE